ncbi:MAG TPA: ABC transporter ATP-binding protein [Spirochaetota bacterium]|nr:ABC transporter ATP-binding protein [Spirochaetota bacterium]
MTTNGIAIDARNLVKIYDRGSERIAAVNDISLQIRTGEYVSFVGPSGSGKTTLINLLGCLDNPSAGSLAIAGTEIFGEGRTLSERMLTTIRRERYGYIFQNFYLIPTLTVLENVTLPFAFYRKENARDDIDRLLSHLGLEGRTGHLPGQLSGGEMQRVAIARALVNRPEILLADEPTGNLDSARGAEVGAVLKRLNEEEGITVITVTHNPALAATAGRTIEIRDGRIAERAVTPPA